MKRIYGAGLAAAAIATLVGLSNLNGANAAQPADGPSVASLARSNAAALGLGQAADLTVRNVITDANGSSHVRFNRTYRGLEVVGGDFVVHQDGSGHASSVSGGVHDLRLSTTPGIAAGEALAAAKAEAGYAVADSAQKLVVFITDGGSAKLAYKVNTSGRDAKGQPAGTETYVDAKSGQVLASWSTEENATGSGTGLTVGTVSLDTTLSGGTYSMVDPLRGNNETHNGPATSAPIFTDADNTWGDGTEANAQSAGVDAHYGIAKTWDYYKNVHGRSGIANDGTGARSFVHDGAYVNASWNDSCFCMKYGDGDGTTYRPLVTLDVAGHEMSHGVTSRTAALRYSGESGGLNESTSDIFGTSVEFYAANSDDVGDYLIGEEIFYDYNPATNWLRRMDHPSADGSSADSWYRGVGRLNVHYSSGVGNHWFYLLSEGSGAKTINGIAYNSPTANGVSMTGIGRDKAEKIWYRTLTTYLTSRSDYAAARAGSISAATDLYGAGSAEVTAVQNAWKAVNVL
ncbi:MAG TPA: M4 family metallopeptidase [Kribbellaceae bacterium]|jgi:Zn-dependent metalloprotease